MLANILLIAFVAIYCAIVLLGHILLLLAVWPHPLPMRPAPENEDTGLSKAGPAPERNLPPRQLAA
jgi:hypothetical protein